MIIGATMTNDFPRAPYMEWAKARPAPAFDLAASAVAACTLDDLPGALDAVELTGPNENGYPPLVDAIAARYGVSPDRVATANGASGANLLACIALVGAGDDVLVEKPAYDPLLAAPRLMGARILRFERRRDAGFALDLARLRAALTPRTRLVILTSPHNPTGAHASASDMTALAALAADARVHVLVDEVYVDASGDRTRQPAATLGDWMVTTSSLTKSYGLAGLRCGWCLASPEVAERVRRARDIVDGVGAYPAERLAAFAFRHLDDLVNRARGFVGPNLERLRNVIAARPEIEWLEPAGGMVAFPRLREVDASDALAAWLLERESTAIVPGRFFEEPQHFRIGFGMKPEVLEGGLAALARALDQHAHRGS
jgi:aspartate/methionine/tyrosine aminotransferase